MNVRKRNMERTFEEVLAGLEVLEATPDVKTVVLDMGYKEEDLTHIRDICAQGKAYYDEKESKNRKKLGLSQGITDKIRALKGEFNACFTAFQTVYKDDEQQLKDLGLRYRRFRRRGEYLERSRDLFTRINTPEHLALVKGYGISAERIQAGLKLITDIEDGINARQAMDGERQRARAKRDKLFANLMDLWRSLETNCIEWFKPNLEVLEGVFNIRTTPPAKKKDDDDPGPGEPPADDPGPAEPVDPDPDVPAELGEPDPGPDEETE